ncbi:MAG: GNAT family N-acetyltransferase [Rhodospirillaceae bacterium]|nr:GNAT family N-acetyltransferase [Rhodospirillaceae bacterium]
MSETDLLDRIAKVSTRLGAVRLRRFGDSDLEAVRDLHGRSFAELAATHYTRAQILAFLGSTAAPGYAGELAACQLWLLEVGHRLGATAGWMVHADAADTARLRKVFVAPELARRGLATLMVGHVEDRARREGLNRFFVRANVNAVPLYARLGYERISAGSMPVADGVELSVVFMQRADGDAVI